MQHLRLRPRTVSGLRVAFVCRTQQGYGERRCLKLSVQGTRAMPHSGKIIVFLSNIRETFSIPRQQERFASTAGLPCEPCDGINFREASPLQPCSRSRGFNVSHGPWNITHGCFLGCRLTSIDVTSALAVHGPLPSVLRYEDALLVPGQTMSAGMTLQSFVVTSTDDTFEPRFVDRTKDDAVHLKVREGSFP